MEDKSDRTMEAFAALSKEKKKTILDAIMCNFGQSGYRKTSTADVAGSAGISKAMVFHYFGSKKRMYLYTLDFVNGEILEAIDAATNADMTDFFEKMNYATKAKMSVLERWPYIFSFLSSTYAEDDEQVKDEVQNVYGYGTKFRNDFLLKGVDLHKFKDTADPKVVLKLLVRIGEGYVMKSPSREHVDCEAIMEEFDECMELLRRNFYKEEFL